MALRRRMSRCWRSTCLSLENELTVILVLIVQKEEMQILALGVGQLIGRLAESRVEFRPGKGQPGFIIRERTIEDAKIRNGPALKKTLAITTQTQRLTGANLALQLRGGGVSQRRNRLAVEVKTHAILPAAAIVGNHQMIPGTRLQLPQMFSPGGNRFSVVTRQLEHRHACSQFNQPTAVFIFGVHLAGDHEVVVVVGRQDPGGNRKRLVRAEVAIGAGWNLNLSFRAEVQALGVGPRSVSQRQAVFECNGLGFARGTPAMPPAREIGRPIARKGPWKVSGVIAWH